MVESATQEETKLCPTCERPIEVSKMRMHEIGCARNNYKCRECGEVVAKADREEHEANAHKLVKCQYCPFEQSAAKFGTHEELCDMRPKQCQWCEQTFSIERWVDHEEACGTKTQKCDICGNFIQKKHWAEHLSTNECQIMQEQNRAKELQDQQNRLAELEKFRIDEEKQRAKMQEKRERRERDTEAQLSKQRERDAMRNIASQQPVRDINQLPSMGVSSGTASRATKNVIVNNKKPVASRPAVDRSSAEEYKFDGPGQRAQPGRGLPRDTGISNRANLNQTGAQRAGGIQTRAQKVQNVPVRKPSPPRRAATENNGHGPQGDSYMDEEAMNAAAIAAAMDEDEGFAFAEQLQNETYSQGGNSSAAGLGAQSMAQPDQYDDSGVRAAEDQYSDQMIGGMEEPMRIDEYQQPRAARVVRPPPRDFGAPAESHFPTAFSQNNFGQAVEAQPDSQMNLGASASQADIDRAIAASMENNHAFGAGAAVEDEDAQLAAILEASKHDM